MKNTTLAFKSLQDLWGFKRHITVSNLVVNVAKKSFTGEFSPIDIEIAKNHFHGIEVELTTFVPSKTSAMVRNNGA